MFCGLATRGGSFWIAPSRTLERMTTRARAPVGVVSFSTLIKWLRPIGGFTASYLRRGDVVLIPVRLGVGLRLGINAGYMRFSEKNRWLPF